MGSIPITRSTFAVAGRARPLHPTYRTGGERPRIIRWWSLKLVVLSRNARLYSTRRLVEAGRKAGHSVRVIDPLRCSLALGGPGLSVHYRGRPLAPVDGVVPRFGASFTAYGSALVRQFELMGVATANRAEAIVAARDKLRSLQLLARAGVALPHTVAGDEPADAGALLELAGEPPWVIKLNQGAQGEGVLLAERRAAGRGMVEALRSLRAGFLVQEFIAEAGGADLRCLVVGGRVIAAMERRAAEGEFRANLHRGGSARAVVLDAAEIDAAVRAADVIGLGVAGVDLLRARRGPLVLEVNASPGLEGIETITGVDVAAAVITHLEGLHTAARKQRRAGKPA